MGCAQIKTKKLVSQDFIAICQLDNQTKDEVIPEQKYFKIKKNPILQRRASQRSPLTRVDSFVTRNQ